MAHAARRLTWDVTVCDTDAAALTRMRDEIYPSRYGHWDHSISLYENKNAPNDYFDLVCIGTPPEGHLALALQSINQSPLAILIEKPACEPSMNLAQEMVEAYSRSDSRVFVGYNHVVSPSVKYLSAQCKELGTINTIDVEFREHWAGIFKAHPWLNGPEDSYLGYSSKGGGASGEYSHALNLWQHLSHSVGAGRVIEVDAMLNFRTCGNALYDDICFFHLKTENSLCGRVVQDVVSTPTRIYARVQGTRGTLEWHSTPNEDIVRIVRPDSTESTKVFSKTRPDDFIDELLFVSEKVNKTDPNSSVISFEMGMDTMLVLAAAHKSHQLGRRTEIDYGKGYTLNALS